MESAYFSYDSSELDVPAREALGRSANCLKRTTHSRIVVSGTTDPRGTEEYNLALGESRAKVAARYLRAVGVPGELTISSTGEEMASGEDEAAWRKERRADIKAE
jgi:peptidoglycan-associated lipoprotein